MTSWSVEGAGGGGGQGGEGTGPGIRNQLVRGGGDKKEGYVGEAVGEGHT